MCSPAAERVAVFTDSNFDTHMVVSVSPNTCVRDFKRQLELEHLKCFPDWGEIRVYGLMVKRKSFFYHLPASMLMKHAFQGKKGTWFVHMEAKKLYDMDPQGLSKSLAAEVENNTCDGTSNPGRPCLSKSVVAEDGKHNSNGTVVHNLLEPEQLITNNELNKCEGKEKKQREEKNQLLEESSEVSSQIVSVTGIIERYFPSSIYGSRDSSPSCSDGVTGGARSPSKGKTVNSCSRVHNNGIRKQSKANRTPLLNHPSAKTCTGKLHGLDVGKCLVNASGGLRMGGSKRRLLSSLQGFKDEKSRGTKSASVIRALAFDISDSD